MAHLKYYSDEHTEFREAYDHKLTCNAAEIIFAKLCRHFKINVRWAVLRFSNRVAGGRCSNTGYITLRWNTNAGILCHEFAHLLEFKKHNHSQHRRRHHRFMARVAKYCVKKKYWQEEITKRLTPKPVQIIPESDKRALMISKRQEQIIRYEKRLNYFTRLYRNKIKRAQASLRMLSKSLTKTPVLDHNLVPMAKFI